MSPQESKSSGSTEPLRAHEGYGACELKRGYRSHLLTGLVLSVMIHLLVIGAYWTSVNLTPVEGRREKVVIVTYRELGPPPSLQYASLSSVSAAKFSLKDFRFGIPIPVPDIELHAEKPFPSQEELSQAGIKVGEGGGGINIPDSVRAELPGEDLEGITPDIVPVLMRMVVPRYPRAALRGKISGTVWVRVLVDEQGAVKSASVLRSDAEVLNQSAVEAARKSLFTPGLYRGKPIPVWISIPIEFKLEQN